MNEGGYKIRNQQAVHFITFVLVEWVDVFTRKDYRDIVLDRIRFCQKEKGLNLHSWCIMSNHLHLIISASVGVSLSHWQVLEKNNKPGSVLLFHH